MLTRKELLITVQVKSLRRCGEKEFSMMCDEAGAVCAKLDLDSEDVGTYHMRFIHHGISQYSLLESVLPYNCSLMSVYIRYSKPYQSQPFPSHPIPSHLTETPYAIVQYTVFTHFHHNINTATATTAPSTNPTAPPVLPTAPLVAVLDGATADPVVVPVATALLPCAL